MGLGATELAVLAALFLVFFGGGALAYVMNMVSVQEQRRGARSPGRAPRRRTWSLTWPLVMASAGLLAGVAALAAFVQYVIFG